VDAFALHLIEEVLTTPKTRKQLIEETGLPERTLRYNISILKRMGRIRELPDFSDLRRKFFVLVRR